LKALKAGKHVLLEKPSVSNAEEARSLFRHPILQGSNAPVLVEASHYRFHPAWHFFLSLFSSADVEEVYVAGGLPGSALSKTDIRFLYPLAGGACMDFGHYAISCMRGVFGAEPTRVVAATPRLVPEGFDQRCDEAMEATYEFPNGGTGRIVVDLATRGGYWFPWLTGNWPRLKDLPPWVSVKLRETRNGEKSTRKEIVLSNFMGPHMWHKIEVTTTETWRDTSGAVVKSETHKESHTAYTWPEETAGQSKGEPHWSTYRYQLEEFVNRVKGRQGSGAWIGGEESIRQMEVNDKTYEKAGMLVRPTCEALEKGA
jgi:predicted dehydrogenase